MIFNYIKIAFRTLLKNKGYSFLNIFGLAVGITCASLIFLWVEDEVSYDANFKKQDQIYYVSTHQEYDGAWRTFSSTPGPLAEAMKTEIPGVVKAARTKHRDFLFSVGDNAINRSGRYVDKDFIEIFSLKFIEGSATNAFNNPNAIVITQEMAEVLYGSNRGVVGKTLKVNDKDSYIITGVMENLPNNITFPFHWIAPFERYSKPYDWMAEYGSFFADTFVELSPEANFSAVDGQVRNLLEKKTNESDAKAFLHSIKDWHLRDHFENGIQVGGRIDSVRLFTIIALIILLIACINFMNLSTARSEKRANEVGVRKAMGSGRSRLIIQFISEALILAFIAALVSALLLFLLLPQFNLLIDKSLTLGLTQPLHLVFLCGITMVCGIFAGLYPAFYLSSFKPVEVLKGLKVTQGSATFIRKGLVVGQFTISIVFIICTILVYQQIQYVKNRDLGYDKEQLISMKVNGTIIEKFDIIKENLVNSKAIESVGLNNSGILDGGNNGSGLKWTGGTNTEDVLISYRYISSDFLETAGIKLAEGRGFSENKAKDSSSVLITESFSKLMGSGSAVGKQINRHGDLYTVIGVVQDFLYDDMYGASDPVLFFNYHDEASFMYLKTNHQVATNEVLRTVKGIMKKYNPAYPFEYSFVDDTFNAKFKSEQLMGKLSQLFALLAILISCLGLFGLAAYTAEQRRKEIGVRKVLGASVTGIIRLLSKDFLKLVGVSILIAIPIAWYAMENWLQDYAYRIEISWWIFAVAGIVALLIAMVTVSFQAIKAAIANPVDSLKTE
ncbi:ABC transporter permease [Winogradskyella bathintestinalis]|uniref:ABC transporter permease n=1 Tax=Winogradskyella bathintestinalis TaxID=3035208 RepID=A0ABT7ZU96_9FLAO|nr:ABC transporter permease [Winogradskyella bathintestinalis]MDN3492576.1 ABC transporter permease [Winogradskyella bathintestinalis]